MMSPQDLSLFYTADPCVFRSIGEIDSVETPQRPAVHEHQGNVMKPARRRLCILVRATLLLEEDAAPMPASSCAQSLSPAKGTP